MRFILYIVYLLLSLSTYAGNNIAFRHFNSSNGLASNVVNSFYKDSRGFIWVCSEGGLTRYDGSNAVTYRHRSNDTNTILSSFIFDICEDKRGNMWIATTSGLSILNPYTNVFTNYIHVDNKKKDSILGEGVRGIAIRNNKVWLTIGFGIVSTDLDHINFKRVTKEQLNWETKRVKTLPYGIFASKQTLWVSTFEGMFVTEDGEHFYNKKYNPRHWKILEKGYIAAFYNDADSVIWFGTWKYNGIYKFNPVKNTLDSFPFALGNEHTFLCFEKHGDILYAGTMTSGIVVFNTRDHKFDFIKSDIGDPKSLSDNLISHIYVDGQGTLFASSTRGLDIYNPLQNQFTTYQYNPLKANSLPGDALTSMIEDSSKCLWVATMSNGIYKLDRDGNVIMHNDLSKIDGGPELCAIIRIEKGNVWFRNGEGIWFYNMSTGKISRPVGLAKEIISFCEQPIDGFHLDKNNNYWFWKGSGSILKYNPKTHESIEFSITSKIHPLPDANIGDFLEDNKGDFWVSFVNYHLLVRIGRYDNRVTKYVLKLGNDRLGYGMLGSIVMRDDSTIWLLSNSKGLFIFNYTTQHLKLYNEGYLAEDHLSTMTKDNMGNLWIFTGNGIIKLDKNTGKQVKFYTTDGLPINEFIQFSTLLYKTPDGHILVSCDRAIIKIDPASIKSNSLTPKPILLSYEKSGKKYFFAATEKVINLSYKDKAIGFNFTAINYIDPDKNLYAYKLEGYDKDWNYCENRTYASYTNLPEGDYTMRIKATNNRENWHVPEYTMVVHVTGPFWRTWWFFVLCLLSAAGASYLAYYFRLRQLIKVQRMRDQISSDLHDEVGSTLSSIAIYSEVANQMVHEKTPSAVPILNSINESARLAMENMSDIVWAINPVNDRFSNIVQRIQVFANQLFGTQNINLQINESENIRDLKLNMQQRKNLYLIFKEALTNVAKYAKASNCYVNIKRGEKLIEIEIKDDGIGFGEQPDSLGGNGLLNIRKRANEMNADVFINSKENEGTTLILRLKA